MRLDELVALQAQNDNVRIQLKRVQDELLKLSVLLQRADADLKPRTVELEGLTKTVAMLNTRVHELEAQIAAAPEQQSRLALAEQQLPNVDAVIEAVRKVIPNIPPADTVPALQLRFALNSYSSPDLLLPDEIKDAIKVALAAVPRASLVRVKAMNLINLAQTWHTSLGDKIASLRHALVAGHSAPTELVSRRQELDVTERRRQTAQAAVIPLQQRRDQVNVAVNAKTGELTALQRQALDLAAQYEKAVEGLLRAVDTKVPLALFPVRLETRFDSQSQLLKIRIFPDDIHHISHLPELTQYEARCASAFWAAGRSKEGWVQLAQLFGPERAAWLWRTLERNGGAIPANTVDGDADTAASLPPYSDVLPDRWVALGYRGGTRVFQKWGRIIAEPLNLLWERDTAEPALWKTNFSKAVELGMGIQVDLRPAPIGDVSDANVATEGVDLLIVLGVRGTLSASDTAARMQCLLDAHHHSWGMELLPRGAATNSSEGSRAAYSSKDPGFERSWALESKSQLPRADGVSAEGERLARALGISPEVFKHVAGASGRDDADAACMNRALWPGTLGYLLHYATTEDAGEARRLTLDETDGVRAFFRDWIRPGGPFRTLRVGNQPYGVLPVSSLDRWRAWESYPDILIAITGPDGSRLRIGRNLTPQGKVEEWSDRQPLAPDSLGGLVRSLAWAVLPSPVVGQSNLLGMRISALAAREAAHIAWSGGVSADGSVQDHTPDWLGIPWSTQPGNTSCAAHAVTRFAAQKELLIARFFLAPDGGSKLELLLINDIPLEAHALVMARATSLLVAPLSGVVEGASLIAVPTTQATSTALLYYVSRAPDGSRSVQCMIGRGLTQDGWRGRTSVRTPASISSAPADAIIRGFSTAIIDRKDGSRDLLLAVAFARAGAIHTDVLIGRKLDELGQISNWDVVLPAPNLAATASLAGLGLAPIDKARSEISYLVQLREIWKKAAAQVPRCVRQNGDPDNDVLKVLGMGPVSRDVMVRTATHTRYIEKLQQVMNPEFQFGTWQKNFTQQAIDARLRLGFSSKLLLDDVVLSLDVDLFEGAIVTNGVVASDTKLIDCPEGDYVGALLKQSLTELHDAAGASANKNDPLLLRLLRHSLLCQGAETSYRISALGRLPPNWEPVWVFDTPATGTPWQYLQVNGAAMYARALMEPPAADTPVGIRETRDCVAQLRGVETGTLEYLLMEHLDSCSHRLDAWITALASQRLADLRRGNPQGVQMGGYGWVEDLRPETARGSTGYVLAPSHAHAVTAAVLRSAFLSHDSSGKGTSLAVDVSSTRARFAEEMLEAVRDGQPLGALLGYRFERALHENWPPSLAMEQYIAPLRKLYPLVVGKLTPTDANSLDQIGASNVVDGLRLLRNKFKLSAAGSDLPAAGTPQAKALQDEIDRLSDAIDALADVLLAEGVFQAARGNALRSGATLDALSRGEAPPGHLDLLQSPRSFTSVTHRLLVLFPDSAPPENDAWAGRWAFASSHSRTIGSWPRALAVPSVNAWVARLLPDPERVTFRVEFEYTDQDGPHTTADTQTRSLRELELCPLDLLCMLPAEDSTQQGELEQRIAFFALARWRPEAVPDSARVRIVFSPPPDTGDYYSVPEALHVARTVRALINSARALEAADLEPPSASEPDPLQAASSDADLSHVSKLITALREDMASFYNVFAVEDPSSLAPLDALKFTDNTWKSCKHLFDLSKNADLNDVGRAVTIPQDLDDLRWRLMRFTAFGLPDALPLSLCGALPDQRGVLLKQAHAIYQRLQTVLSKADDELKLNSNAHGAIQILFGKGLCSFLPVVDQAAWAPVQTVLGKAAAATPTKVRTWLMQMSKVRRGACRFQDALNMAEALETGDKLQNLSVGQLPVEESEGSWVGSGMLTEGATAYAIHAPIGLPSTGSVRGFFVDEWIERMPIETEQSCLAFHYDAPDSCAPQAILLAVPPNPDAPWDLTTLEAVVRETLDLARIRAVDYQALPDGGHVLPALYFAFNPKNETISTDFRSAKT